MSGNRIDGPSSVNNDIIIGNINQSTTETQQMNSSFGDGFKNDDNYMAITRRHIPGFNEVLAKFNDVSFQDYSKNTPQLTIEDKYYIQDGNYKDATFCEV